MLTEIVVTMAIIVGLIINIIIVKFLSIEASNMLHATLMVSNIKNSMANINGINNVISLLKSYT